MLPVVRRLKLRGRHSGPRLASTRSMVLRAPADKRHMQQLRGLIASPLSAPVVRRRRRRRCGAEFDLSRWPF
jgi:hypothetical protein